MTSRQAKALPEAPLEQRLDRWLWFARAIKSRTLAAAQIEAGKIRVNAVKAVKPSETVKAGDVITSSVSKDVRILKVIAIGSRRGPAAEAQLLYEDMTPAPASKLERKLNERSISGQRDAGSGRPTKRDRRMLEKLHSQN